METAPIKRAKPKWQRVTCRLDQTRRRYLSWISCCTVFFISLSVTTHTYNTTHRQQVIHYHRYFPQGYILLQLPGSVCHGIHLRLTTLCIGSLKYCSFAPSKGPDESSPRTVSASAHFMDSPPSEPTMSPLPPDLQRNSIAHEQQHTSSHASQPRRGHRRK